MNLFTITIGNQLYEYVNSIFYQGKNYVALANEDFITINEYLLVQGKMILTPIREDLFYRLKEEMKL